MGQYDKPPKKIFICTHCHEENCVPIKKTHCLNIPKYMILTIKVDIPENFQDNLYQINFENKKFEFLCGIIREVQIMRILFILFFFNL